VSGRKPLVAVWRDAVRDAQELDRTAKLVAFILSTYMNGHGSAWPSQDTIAAGASLTDRAVHTATVRLERAGFLEVERSRGRSSHQYVATLPLTANAVRRSEWATANGTAPNSERRSSNSERRSPESVESAESGALSAAAALWGDAASALIEDECIHCGERKPIHSRALTCVICDAKRQADLLINGVRADLEDTRIYLAAKRA
jgi:hypothetical protein